MIMRRSKSFLLSCLLITLTTSAACSTSPPPRDITQAAQEAYTAENWVDTERLYGQLVEQDEKNGRYWYRLAVAQRYLGQFSQALASLETAASLGVPASFTDYERAKVAATQNKPSEAIKFLQSAASAGLSGKDKVFDNEHLAKLAGLAGFDEMVDQLDANANPCRGEKFRQFDFWIGTWDVVQAGGQPAGRNTITARESDCVLLEEWKSASGWTGMSMNFYDGASGKWVQQWISPGLQLRIEGGLKDGSMVLEGDVHYTQKGNTAPFRGKWTLLEDGRVRQFFEQADEDGNWTTWFEGFYTKVEVEAIEGS